MCVQLSATHQVLLSPELVTQILSHPDKSALARLSTVSKFWYWERARHLWATCDSLEHLDFNVSLEQHENIASFVRHIHIKRARQLWDPSAPPSMPAFLNLRSFNIHADSLYDP